MHESEVIEIKKETHDTNIYFNKIKGVKELNSNQDNLFHLCYPLMKQKNEKE